MSTVDNLAQEQIWFEKPRYDEAERRFYEHVYSSSQPQEAQVGVCFHLLNVSSPFRIFALFLKWKNKVIMAFD